MVQHRTNHGRTARLSFDEPTMARFLAYVQKTDTCWLWMGKLSEGYGRFGLDGQASLPAHRVAYRLWVDAARDEHHVHHVCRVKNCVNPEHLVLVRNNDHWRLDESITTVHAARTQCPKGHSYDVENTAYHRSPGRALRRACRECARQQTRARSLRTLLVSGRAFMYAEPRIDSRDERGRFVTKEAA